MRIYQKLRDTLRTDSILDFLEKWKDLAKRVWNELKETTFLLGTT